ncbi:MAG: serine--tRNA ligase [Phototrophicales bacterium]|nr:serine--tRNA ligase [Phototrophicales bacterium]
MLDIALIREKPDWVKEQLSKLNDPPALARVDAVLEIDMRRRELLIKSERLQAGRNKLNKSSGMLRGNKQLTDADKIARALGAVEYIHKDDIDQAEAVLMGNQTPPSTSATGDLNSALETLTDLLREMGDLVNALNDQLRTVDADLEENLMWIPNIPHESVPVADSDESNIAWQPEGIIPEFDFTPKPHWELGVELGMIDFERGVKLAGSRAYVLRGWGARLQRALEAFFLDMAREKGFEEVYVPFFVKEDMLYGAGQFPKFADVVYHDQDADIYMLPTSEVAITNLFRDEILDESQLPLYFVADTPCFRREKSSAGRDTRGIKRVHQFQKVEMYKFTTPETSYAELEGLVVAACDICRALGLPHRRLEIVTGDLGFSATKKYDVEVWAAGSGEWLEVSSCSNTEAFQARRANVKYRPTEGKKAQFVHTLNGSGLATPRILIAIMENYQQADGSVIIPEVLRPYLAGADKIPAKG